MKLMLRILFFSLLMPVRTVCTDLSKEREFVELIKNLSSEQLKALMTHEKFEYQKSIDTKWLIGISVGTLIVGSSIAFMQWSANQKNSSSDSD